jgi:methyl-accepting chemotaxis protein
MLGSVKLKTKLPLTIVAVVFLAVAIIIVVQSVSVVGLAKEEALDKARESAYRHANEIRAVLESRMDVARTLAQTMSALKKQGATSRISVYGILSNILLESPGILALWSGWEPNVFDGQDAIFEGKRGHDETGRFIPYYYRDESSSIQLAPLVGYARDGMGDYYQRPFKTGREVVMDPFVRKVGEIDMLVTALAVPISENDQNVGVTGVDVTLDSLQNLVADVRIYETGTLSVISHNGTYVACPTDSGLIGTKIEASEPWIAPYMTNIDEGRSFTNEGFSETLNEYVYRIGIPVQIGATDTPWAILVTIPRASIMAKPNQILLNSILAGLAALLIAALIGMVISRAITGPIGRAVKLAETIRSGDLSQRLNMSTRDEIGQMAGALDSMAEGLEEKARIAEDIARGDMTREVALSSDRDVLGRSLHLMTQSLNDVFSRVIAATDLVSTGSHQISASSQSLSQGAAEQAAALEEITSSMTELDAQTKTNAEHAAEANTLASRARETAENGNGQMESMVEAMAQISNASKEISKINKTIDDIAFQTNLLALNAAVEAARAGKHGKGFAVVAQEVRHLASRSAEASKETAVLIESALKKVGAGSEVVDRTADSFRELVAQSGKVSELVHEIAQASTEQALGISQISQGLSQVEQVTQQNTSNAEEMAASAEELARESGRLKKMLERFNLKARGHNDDLTADEMLDVQTKALPSASFHGYERNGSDD